MRVRGRHHRVTDSHDLDRRTPHSRRCEVNVPRGGRDHLAVGPLGRAWGVLGGVNQPSREGTTFIRRTTAAILSRSLDRPSADREKAAERPSEGWAWLGAIESGLGACVRALFAINS